MAATLRVRWRLGGGATGAWQGVSCEDEEERSRARQIVEAHRKNITGDEVQALLTGVDLASVKGGPKREKVEDLIEPYLASRHQTGPGQRDRIRQIFRDYLLPVFGGVPVDEVTPDHVDAVLRRMKRCTCKNGVLGEMCRRQRGLKPGMPHQQALGQGTVDGAFNAMKGFFAWAVEREKRSQTPLKGVNYKPRTMAGYRDSLKTDEHYYMYRKHFRILRDRFDPRYRTFLEYLVQTGSRYSEATALTVQSVFLDDARGPVVLINEAWKKNELGLPDTIGLPKNGRSRWVGILNGLAELLSAQIAGKGPTDLVFEAPQGGRLDSANFWNCFWTPGVTAAQLCPDHPVANRGKEVSPEHLRGPLCGDNGGMKKRGQPCRFRVVRGWDRCGYHLGPDPELGSDCACDEARIPRSPKIKDLRHTHVAQLIAQRVPIPAIAERVGHRNTQVTEQIYGWILERPRVAAVLASDMDGDDDLSSLPYLHYVGGPSGG